MITVAMFRTINYFALEFKSIQSYCIVFILSTNHTFSRKILNYIPATLVASFCV